MILLLDGDFLCHRAYHSVGRIYRKGKRLEVAFSVLREAAQLYERYQPESMLWCFDSRHNLRKQVCPEYKANRNPNNEDRRILWRQMRRLRKYQLRSFGFRNIFLENGYEADDLIAHLVKQVHFASPAVIVSADGDLKQCLAKNVRIYNPLSKNEETEDDFIKQWGITPKMWATAKAIAGCKSDNITGVPGVAERTAIRWLKGDLNKKSNKYRMITRFCDSDLYDQNVNLVRLPYKGLRRRKYKIRRDHLTRGQWMNALDKLGLEHIPYPKG